MEGAKVSQGGVTLDYTKIPTELEQKFDKFDENNALRPTIINIGETWSKSYQKSLLSEPEKKQVYSAVCEWFMIFYSNNHSNNVIIGTNNGEE